MRTDFYYPSTGSGQIHACLWQGDTAPKAVVQIVHGIAEYVERYDDFAEFLCANGIAVVAEDHMGHGKSIGDGTMGYFEGGWFAAVADTYQLMQDTMAKFPGIPYVLFGHSMGSFMARSLLAKYPQCGITAAVICGTAWQPGAVLAAGKTACKAVCAMKGERHADSLLNSITFGSYNKRVEHPKTAYDWLSRDAQSVAKYVADPLCGFIPTAGLLRDMLTGIGFNQQKASLSAMKKDLPVLFVAGGDDPVGAYGKGVQQAAKAFRDHGMQDVSLRIFPLCRHEILNEINKEEIYHFLKNWIESKI